MLKLRIITASVLAICLLSGLYWLTAFQLSIVFALICSYAAWEWSNLAGLNGNTPRILFVLALTGGIWLMGRHTGLPITNDNAFAQLFCGVALVGWVIALLLVKSYPESASLWKSVTSKLLMGLLILSSAWIALVSLLFSPQSKAVFLLVVLIVAVADIGAYFSGKLLGKHKLAPRVSPGKTWEGLLGGLVANLLLLVGIINWYNIPAEQWLWLGLLFLLPALLSVVGDLFESVLKRERGLKDSGAILPGHGGLLDRIDGLLAALPGFAVVFHISGFPF